MKKHSVLVIALIAILLIGSCGTLFAINIYSSSGYNQKEGTEGKFLERYDEFQQITWIQHQFYDTESSEPLRLYIGEIKGKKWLRGVFRYHGRDWIFYDEVILIDSKGNRLSWNVESYDKQNDVSHWGGYVTETYDFLLSDTDVSTLYNILEDETVKLRMVGDNYRDYKLEPERITALKEILEYYFK